MNKYDDPGNLFMSALESLFEITTAMEAPVDVTGDTDTDTANALGPDARTTATNNDDLNTKNLDSPAGLLSDENSDKGGGNNEEDPAEGDGTGEDTGEEDPNADPEAEGGEGEGDDPNATPEEDPMAEDPTSTDDDSIKKRRLLENMQEFHTVIQKNADLLAKCNVSTVSANIGDANSKVISILNDMADIIYRTITDGTWESSTYTDLMRKYVTLNTVFDIVVKMLDENVSAAEKERAQSIKAAKLRAKRYNTKLAKNIRTTDRDKRGYTGQTPRGRFSV